ncbi:neprilysin-1-like isoform X2 [Pomacea canaliculata]|uniref:neprilysin-1-like isoform X2 n=1 Tax=Pomacea canaliculata TaxID=400727 RepID=UPI000D72EB05|nr:neprilysin-1-like isoform X2 [Pomacea canaliculata]
MADSSTAGSNTVLSPEKITFSTKRILTTSEKWLIFAVIILFVAFLVFLGLFIAFCVKYNEVKESATVAESVCQTFECLDSAAYIAKSINISVDPCENFYHFACGRWLEDHQIPADDITVSAFSIISEDIKQTLKELLILDDPEAPEAVMQARTYFRSCEDVDTIDKLGKKPLLDLLDLNGRGIYPTLQPSWTDTGMTFSDIVEYLTNWGAFESNALIIMSVVVDEMQSDNHIILFSQTDLILPSRDMYLGERNSTELNLLENLYGQVLEALGANATTAGLDAEDVVDFEIQLAKALDPPEKLLDRANQLRKMSLANLTKTFPEFDWLDYLHREFNKTGEIYNITLDEMVAIDALEYYTKLFALVNKTSSRTLLNYCVWRHVWSALPYLDKELRDLHANFNKILYGTRRLPERWKTCVQQTDDSFPYAVGRLYVDKRFSQEDKQRMEKMIDSLIRTFRELLQGSSWMTQPTKEAALKKLSFITRKIGYPDLILNDTALNAKSDMYEVDLQNFFGTVNEINKKDYLWMLKNLRKPVDRTKWFMSASTVNAYYDPSSNEIVFPAGILNPPFYSKTFSDAHIYGSIGVVIAHELTHGFDTTGSTYDEKGNLRQWWQEDDLKNFQSRTQCMVDQYNQFVDKELNMTVNGRLTIGENIADCGGVKGAFRAYRSVITERGQEENKYPTLPYTQNQIFFIGFAQLWCSRYLPKFRAVLLQTDPHSPDVFRVLGSIQNSKEFGEVFNCPVGTPMNPQKKCEVW